MTRLMGVGIRNLRLGKRERPADEESEAPDAQYRVEDDANDLAPASKKARLRVGLRRIGIKRGQHVARSDKT